MFCLPKRNRKVYTKRVSVRTHCPRTKTILRSWWIHPMLFWELLLSAHIISLTYEALDDESPEQPSERTYSRHILVQMLNAPHVWLRERCCGRCIDVSLLFRSHWKLVIVQTTWTKRHVGVYWSSLTKRESSKSPKWDRLDDIQNDQIDVQFCILVPREVNRVGVMTLTILLNRGDCALIAMAIVITDHLDRNNSPRLVVDNGLYTRYRYIRDIQNKGVRSVEYRLLESI